MAQTFVLTHRAGNGGHAPAGFASECAENKLTRAHEKGEMHNFVQATFYSPLTPMLSHASPCLGQALMAASGQTARPPRARPKHWTLMKWTIL